MSIGIPTIYFTGPRGEHNTYDLPQRRSVIVWIAKHVDPEIATIARIVQDSDCDLDAICVNGRPIVTALTLLVWFTKHNRCHLIVPSADGLSFSEQTLHKLDIKKEIEAANDKAKGRSRDYW